MVKILKRLAVLVLSIPFMVFGIAFDIMKLPFLILAIPIWIIMDLIDVLNGEGSDFFPTLLSFIFMGFCMWADMVNLRVPYWMDK